MSARIGMNKFRLTSLAISLPASFAHFLQAGIPQS
jgi:hypothetical protein